MISAVDSAFAPTADQAQQAHDAGTKGWWGYLATKPNVGLYHPWSQDDFSRVRVVNPTPVAFCSGWDDPDACRQLAKDWQVRLSLDVESGIRGDGSWVQPWLDTSGAGLYGNLPIHSGRRAPFHILSWYVNDPNATWTTSPPAEPHGWQWYNSHTEFGVTVDRGWYDDWFAPAKPPPPLWRRQNAMVVVASSGPDQHSSTGQGAEYLVDGCVKFYLSTPEEVTNWLSVLEQPQPKPISQFTVDRLPEVPRLDTAPPHLPLLTPTEQRATMTDAHTAATTVVSGGFTQADRDQLLKVSTKYAP